LEKEKKGYLKLNKINLISFLLLTSFIIYSCEDDALLTPKTEEECLEGPSYCNLSMPGDKVQLLAYNPERF
tara:strand:+ start:285 stop:497 length:213 start_codon:yes stop_codon:yes gene_type:complete